VRGGIGYADVSPDGRRLVTAGRDGKARIVDVATGRMVRALDLGPGNTSAGVASFSSDGNLVVGARIFIDRTSIIRVFDAHTGRSAGPRLQAGSGVVLARFLPNDPTRLVTVSPNDLIRWDLSDPERPRRIGAPLPLPENPHPQPLTLFTISPDGRTALTSAAGVNDLGPDGSTFVWDLESGSRLLGPLPGRPGPFTPDGSQLTLRQSDRIAFVDAATGADRSTLIVGFTPLPATR
jgi:WD40 repeat protein